MFSLKLDGPTDINDYGIPLTACVRYVGLCFVTKNERNFVFSIHLASSLLVERVFYNKEDFFLIMDNTKRFVQVEVSAQVKDSVPLVVQKRVLQRGRQKTYIL